ncbi:TPA: iron transporter [Vibrio vulnificus]|nr:iron transporter [Vibrio vulnificus]
MAQCFRFGWRRCSPLNWALGTGWKIGTTTVKSASS